MTDAHKNAGRFRGFAGLYHDARPACPEYVTDVLTRYLGRRPGTVVDMGCGTGRSTLVWRDKADQIIGVDPGEDSTLSVLTVVFGFLKAVVIPER